MLINSTGAVDNASSSSVSNAIVNGYNSCSGSTSISHELDAPDELIVIYPNPTNSVTTIKMNLDVQEEISVCIKSIDGKIIAQRSYGMMVGSHTLTFDVSSFSEGIYLVETIIGNEVITNKFVKE